MEYTIKVLEDKKTEIAKFIKWQEGHCIIPKYSKQQKDKDLAKIVYIEKAIALLQQPPENLQCCGNCGNNEIENTGNGFREEYCKIDAHFYEANGGFKWCKDWTFDGLKKADRGIKE